MPPTDDSAHPFDKRETDVARNLLVLLVQADQLHAAEARRLLHIGEGLVQLDHCGLGGDLGRHRLGQGVKRRLTDGGGQARVLSTAGQGLGEAPRRSID